MIMSRETSTIVNEIRKGERERERKKKGVKRKGRTSRGKSAEVIRSKSKTSHMAAICEMSFTNLVISSRSMVWEPSTSTQSKTTCGR